MQNSYIIESQNDSTFATASHVHQEEMQNNKRANENTCLTPNNNQTYFADEKVHIPETENVVYIGTNGA